MAHIKANELSGSALDWAVANCEGRKEPELVNNFAVAWYTWRNTHYSTNWAQGGPIIDRIEGLQFKHWLESKPEACCEAHIHNCHGDWFAIGPTLLIAAMRCYVASKLGDTVEVPDELIK